MNSVNLIGRLTKDPELRYTESQMAVARFSIAINRGKDKNGQDKGADFINIVVFGKQAENCEKYTSKGKMLAVSGHIQTGSYENKDGKKVYTTDVVADKVQFIEWKDKETATEETQQYAGFTEISDDEIPF